MIKEKKLAKMNVGRLCKLFGKSRQAYYAREEFYNEQFQENQVVLELVAQIRRDLPALCTKKLYHLLREPFKTHGIKMGRDKLHELLTKHGMLIRRNRRVLLKQPIPGTG